MSPILLDAATKGSSLLSLVLMGVFGVKLLVRLLRVLRGQEEASCPPRRGGAYGRGVLLAMLAAVLSRMLIYLIAWWMYRAMGREGGFFETLKPLWIHWDTRHYLNIAQNGYTNVGDERLQIVFFPLYPALMRLVSAVTGGDVFYAGLAVSLVCSALCAGLLYALAEECFDRRTGALAVGYFLLSPLSVFLCCAYTEALFICLTLLTVMLQRHGHPYLAALCGMFSALTRMPGVIVAGLFIIAAIGRLGQGKLRIRDAAACALQVAIVFMGLVIYWLINDAVTGDPMTYMTYQRENWYQAPGSFWQTTENTAYYFLTTMGDDDWLFTWGFQLVCIFYVLALLAASGGRLPFDLAAYSFVYVAVVLAPTWLLSGPRYLYALAPLPILKARAHKGWRMHLTAMALSGALLIIWIFGYTIAVEVL